MEGALLILSLEAVKEVGLGGGLTGIGGLEIRVGGVGSRGGVLRFPLGPVSCLGALGRVPGLGQAQIGHEEVVALATAAGAPEHLLEGHLLAALTHEAHLGPALKDVLVGIVVTLLRPPALASHQLQVPIVSF